MYTRNELLSGFFGVVSGLLFIGLVGFHMHNQAMVKNARISLLIGPQLHGVVTAVSPPRKQTFVLPGTGLLTELQKTATLRYRTDSGEVKTLTVFPADGLAKNQKLSFYNKPGGKIATESGKESPSSIWASIVMEAGLLGSCVGIVIFLLTYTLIDAPWRQKPTLRITG